MAMVAAGLNPWAAAERLPAVHLRPRVWGVKGTDSDNHLGRLHLPTCRCTALIAA